MKYNQNIVDEICKYIKQGMTQKDAAILADINELTFYRWKKKYVSFASALKKAEMECKNRNIVIIQKAAITTWQAAAWFLERRYFDEYGIRQKISGDANNPITIMVNGFSLRKYPKEKNEK